MSNNKNPIVSIIIPVYNAAPFVERAIKSVSNFSKIDYEIICVNDGSTDNSLEILNDIQASNTRLKVVTQVNQGLSGARNTGLKHAAGVYIMFLDADDWLLIEPHTLAKTITFIQENNIQVYGFGLKYYDEQGVFTGDRQPHSIPYEVINTGSYFLKNGYQPSSSCLFVYEQQNLKDNNLEFYPKISQQDVEFTVRLMLATERVYFSKNLFYGYYRHVGTITIPKSLEAKKKYMGDAITVANQVKNNLKNKYAREIIQAIQKNYNSITWNLLWRLCTRKNEVDAAFKMACVKRLKENDLYPIKGPLKSPFQRVTRIFFNQEWLLKLVLK